MQSARAVDVGFDGYFRTRPQFFYNLDMDRHSSPNRRAYTDFRFRLDPTFYLTDKLRVRSSLDILDGNFGDSVMRAGPYRNPASSYDRQIDATESESSVGRPIANDSDSVYGGVYQPDGQTNSVGLKTIQLRRAWLEWDFDYGTLKVGRMPNQFGLGIFANGGDAADQDVGQSRDRIMYETSLGAYYLKPGLGWTAEGALDQSADDFHEFFFIFGRKTENQDFGIYLSYNIQDSYRTTVTTNLADKETSLWVVDFFAQHQFSLFRLESEVVLYTGKTVGFDTLAVNGVLRGDYKNKGFGLLAEAGVSTGTDASDVLRGKMNTVAFSRDYNVSMIVFEEALPGGKTTKNAAGTVDNVPTAPHSGAISNAFYPRLMLSYDVADYFKPSLNVISPFGMKAPLSGGGKWYGIEYDIITRWPVHPHLEFDLSFAHFLPNGYYSRVSPKDSVFLVRGGLVAKF